MNNNMTLAEIMKLDVIEEITESPVRGRNYLLKNMKRNDFFLFCYAVDNFIDYVFQEKKSHGVAHKIKKKYYDSRRKLKDYDVSFGYCTLSDVKELNEKYINSWSLDDLVEFNIACLSVKSIERRLEDDRLNDLDTSIQQNEKLIRNINSMMNMDAYDKKACLEVIIAWLDGSIQL